jgi:hypothetical protein
VDPRRLSEEALLLEDRLRQIEEEMAAADGAMLSSMRALCYKGVDAEVERIKLGQMSPGFAGLLKTMTREDVDRLVRERNQRKRVERELQAAERLRTALLTASPQQLYVALTELMK